MASLVRKHRHQVLERDRRVEPIGIGAYIPAPGDQTNSFLRKRRLPLRSPCHIVQTSVRTVDRHDRPRVEVACRGYRATVNPSSAAVLLGGPEESRFNYDLGYPCFAGARGRLFDPFIDEGRQRLLQLLLEMDRVRERAHVRGYQLPVLGELDFPSIELGFADGHLPAPEFSAAFVGLVCRKMRLEHPKDLSGLDEGARKELVASVPKTVIEDLWASVFVPPWRPAVTDERGQAQEPATGDPQNLTGHWLVDHSYCSKANQSYRNYENVSKLIGADIWNPAAKVIPKEGVITLPSPAPEILRLVGSVSEANVAVLVAEFRHRMGPRISPRLSDDQVMDILGAPGEPLRLVQGSGLERVSADDLPPDLLAKAMRAALEPRFAECCEDKDLVCAAINPGDRLFAAGLAKVQLFRARANVAEEFMVSPVPGRPKLSVDFWATGAYGRPSRAAN